jgi:hypothetical protein
MIANDVLKLLEARHSKDAFFSEVAIDSNRRRMDAWAMIPSYSKSLTIAYEIKVTRRDFVQDTKMHEYTIYANEAYMVCPSDVAKPDELPDGWGLLIVSGSRLMTKKKAQYRETNIPEAFYQALIASKVRHYGGSVIDREIARRVAGISEYQGYIEGKKTLADIGYQMGRKLSEDLYNFEREKSRFESRKENLESRELAWKKVCEQVKSELKVDISRMYDTDWDRRDIFAKLKEVLASPEYNMFDAIEQMYQKMQELKIKLAQEA